MRRALGVCVCCVVHVVTHSLFARGEIARPSPSAEHGHCRTPTLRVDTLPPREGPTCNRTPPASSTDLSGVRTCQGSRRSTARRSPCQPLPLAASGIRNCEEQEKLRGTPGDENFTLQTWRHPECHCPPEQPEKMHPCINLQRARFNRTSPKRGAHIRHHDYDRKCLDRVQDVDD